jgi:SAM-dependent methyltransferase
LNAQASLDLQATSRKQLAAIRDYWNAHIHDLAIARHAIGTPEFFQDLAAYRFEKLDYLPRVVDFAAFAGQRLLEVGCGVGIDLARFAGAGSIVTGVDLAPTAIDLARLNFAQRSLPADLQVMNGEALEFENDSFDAVYAHGVLQYTADARQMISELKRVLRPSGLAIFMVYNRHSWLNVMSKFTKVELEHVDAPALKLYSSAEFRELLGSFGRVRLVWERYPVATRLHHGFKARLYNRLFVPAFNALPRRLTRPLGWHLLSFCHKSG